jgi:hypothetical protein
MTAALPTTPCLPATRLTAPALSLRSCVRAYITRNTMATPLPGHAQRLNRFPASPLCSITWFMQGEAEMVDPPPDGPATWVPIFFSGPQSRPLLSYNPGPVEAFTVMFFPTALHRLAGLDISACMDRFFPLPEVLGPEWVAMAEAVLRAPNDNARIELIEAFLDPRWQGARGDEQRWSVVGDWVRRLANQAATSGLGNGVRNVERRVKSWAGQPMRTLRRMSRAEQAFLEACAQMSEGKVSWVDVAARGGYADQAHMCREAREITGLSPTELVRARNDDESYWVYRIWS